MVSKAKRGNMQQVRATCSPEVDRSLDGRRPIWLLQACELRMQHYICATCCFDTRYPSFNSDYSTLVTLTWSFKNV
ncbi:hypothetical protein ABENE_06920 [Asticcacaulis benevestitus DSM 16100 = ATCC BAA-896]|uniref:Uncharacterized protein n=1 Tax=Asticcacaulis benevestitus DSM 16100 = ATCC BAA-896 TaxID=1121022 RepID=V4RNL3_9CAUL|nr:hypothetical protein ABENE_06920 [Asticcacaulis benevestitus DSM 16100 = ATCC BAA-896]